MVLATVSIATMIPRPNHPASVPGTASIHGNQPRLNLLLSHASWRHDDPLDQLPPLLNPLGIYTVKAASGEEAAEAIQRFTVHIAVVDLAIPFERCTGSAACAAEAGPRVLQLLRRLDAPPPTVVVRPPQPASRESARSLTQALRDGAFAVLDQPVRLEAMLEVLRRIVRRHYSDCWPA